MKERTPLIKIDLHGSPLSAVKNRSDYSSYRCSAGDEIVSNAEELMGNINVVEDEFEQLVKLALPIIVTYALEVLPSVVTILFVGHVESEKIDEQIAAASLSVLLLNVTAMATGFGLATALDTLCSQAYGAGNTVRMGVYLQTSFLVLSAWYLFVYAINFNSSEILQLLGQPVAVAQLAGKFSRQLLPGVPFMYLYDLLKRVLLAQNIANPMIYVAILVNIINISLGYYLCFHTTLGFLGAAVSRAVSNICCPVIFIPYMLYSGLMTPLWAGFKWKNALDGVQEFLELGIPGMLQVCLEWWAFEAIALLCGLLPNDPVAAIGSNSLILNMSYLTWTLYSGVSGAAKIRVGNALGAGSPVRATVVWKISMILAALISLVGCFCYLAFRTKLPGLFTHEKSIQTLTSSLMYVAAAFQVADSINCVAGGILQGSRRQVLGAKLNFIAYYFAGLPLGILFGFSMHLGVIGLWIGVTIGIYVTAIVGVKIVSESNWPQLCLQAQNRTSKSDTPDFQLHNYESISESIQTNIPLQTGVNEIDMFYGT